MALRLVLVSMVAGLGVSPPAENDLAAWTRSVQTWMESRLAEWEVRQPLDVATCEDVPAAVDAEPGLEELMDEVKADLKCGLAANSPTDIAAPTVGTDLEFDAVVDEIVAEFVEYDVVDPDAPIPGVSPSLALEAPLPSENAASVDRDDLVAGESEEVDLAETEIDEKVQVPQYEPLEVGEDLYPGLAYSLNDEADGIDVLPRAGINTREVARDGGSPLGDAVRLTRDAVYAWMNLLQSPAIMAIPR